MTSYNRDGKVGPWAQEKLECLGGYLAAYTTILRKQDWCRGYFYVDAFAGAGRAALRAEDDVNESAAPLLANVGAFGFEDADEAAYIDGSPHVALEIQHPFTRYVFIEKNVDRAQQLNEIAARYKDRREIQIVQADASAAIKRVLDDAAVDWRTHRAVVFLDPFGMQVPWTIIEQIAANRKIEIILNLPVGMAIQRLLPRSGIFTEQQRKKLNEYFGSPDWEKVIYEKAPNLFGDTDTIKVEGSGERLAKWYQKWLERAFGYAPNPRLIRNSQGSHLYYLLWAGPNKTGHKIASHILNQGEQIRRAGRGA
jgi:three-Cys-motif partner protein